MQNKAKRDNQLNLFKMEALDSFYFMLHLIEFASLVSHCMSNICIIQVFYSSDDNTIDVGYNLYILRQ